MLPVQDDNLEKAIVERILATGSPDRVVLFGSRGRGDARTASDFDLLIVQPSSQPRYARSGAYYRAVADLPVEVDIVVYTPEEAAEWASVPKAFVTTALTEGRILYERAH